MQEIKKNNYDLCYYDDCWQTPVITEYNIFNLLKKNPPMNYFAFPWASYIDNKHIRKYNQLYGVIDSQIEINSKRETIYFTVCQHIRFREIMHLFQALNIKYIFTPHKVQKDAELEEKYNVTIIPISLYPIHYNVKQINDNINKKYLASFVGAYNDVSYMSQIRKKMIEQYSDNEDILIKHTNEWHFQSHVYKKTIRDDLGPKELTYKEILSESKFSLCPSGSGPNSIRLWESLSYGSIPVILSDSLILPDCGVDYNEYFIFWKEDELSTLYDYLKQINDETISKMSKKCVELYYAYFHIDSMHKSIEMFFSKINSN